MSLRPLYNLTSSAHPVAERERLLPFMVVDWGRRNAAPGFALALTPRVMDWGDGFWLLDLDACASYWQAQAARRGTDAVSLVRLVLNSYRAPRVPDDAGGVASSVTGLQARSLLAPCQRRPVRTAPDTNLGLDVPIRAQLEGAAQGNAWRAALARHPWQALLLARHLRERKLRGLVSFEGTLGQQLYRELDWETWWTCIDALAKHRKRLGMKPCDLPTYQRQKAQMQRAVKRLGLRSPWELRQLSSPAVRRRFGALVRDAWDWAYGETGGMAAGLFQTAFPWQAVAVEDKPRVVTHLDDPLCEWPHVEALLREDFDRLCDLSSWQAGERVVSLEWRLVFRDLSHLSVPIRFRHPHSLHLERGLHATALLQAFYAFEGAVPRQTDTDDYVIPIVGWSLTIDERLRLPARAVGLFGDQQQSEELALLTLENKLKVPLEAYELLADWLPEDSFQRVGIAGAAPPAREADGGQAVPTLMLLGRRRPLFLYKTPHLYDNGGRSTAWEFCERTMSKWWGGKPESTLQRDYYRVLDREMRSFWVFRDTRGQCFVHGLYA